MLARKVFNEWSFPYNNKTYFMLDGLLKSLCAITPQYHLTTPQYRPYYNDHFADETNPKYRGLKPKVTHYYSNPVMSQSESLHTIFYYIPSHTGKIHL